MGHGLDLLSAVSHYTGNVTTTADVADTHMQDNNTLVQNELPAAGVMQLGVDQQVQTQREKTSKQRFLSTFMNSVMIDTPPPPHTHIHTIFLPFSFFKHLEQIKRTVSGTGLKTGGLNKD